MMTWLRGARCTDPEEMPEMEARPPAENRHGGAPRGERPASWDAPRLTRADPSRLANATTEIVRLSALRPPLQGDGRDHTDTTRAQQHAAGTNNTALFDIVNRDDGQRIALRAATSRARVPGERSETRDPGGFTAKSMDIETSVVSPLGPRVSFRSRKVARYTRPGHETDVCGQLDCVPSWFETRLAALLTMKRKRAPCFVRLVLSKEGKKRGRDRSRSSLSVADG